MTTHIGREYGVLNPFEKLNLRLIESDEDVIHSDTSVTLFTLPAYTLVVGLGCKVTEAFDAVAKIELGDGSTTNLYGTWEGALAATGTYVVWPMYEEETATSITATLTTAATTGESTWFLIFRPQTLDRNP